jgi:DNA-binding transcriptional LysR family regulator
MLNRTDVSRLDLNLLVLFEVVFDERHVRRAAERLNLSPSAVSHGIARLRRMLNDPLFLRTPRGVEPTARALQVAAPIAAVLAQARGVIELASPFDPTRSARRFSIGAPDGISAVILPALLARIGSDAPGIDVSLRQVLPVPGALSPDRAWRGAFADLDNRSLDVAIIPHAVAPARFHVRHLYDEDFLIVMREGHPFAGDPTPDRYCALQHLVVSTSGEAYGFVDDILASHGLKRRIALTVPNFMLALAVIAETDLVSALPRRLMQKHGHRFGLKGLAPPVAFPTFRLSLVVPEAALTDRGLVWLLDLLVAP